MTEMVEKRSLDELEDAGAREMVVYSKETGAELFRFALGAVCVVHGPVYGREKAKHQYCWELRRFTRWSQGGTSS